jgi:hypothetical protein
LDKEKPIDLESNQRMNLYKIRPPVFQVSWLAIKPVNTGGSDSPV